MRKTSHVFAAVEVLDKGMTGELASSKFKQNLKKFSADIGVLIAVDKHHFVDLKNCPLD